jgi:acyl-coenzyme A thioesterase PaaI-like protein
VSESQGDKIVPLTQDELQKMLDNSPFIAFLGLRVTETDPANERITMTCAMRPEFERGKGTGQWHGGPLAAIIDTVGDYALIMALRRGLPTINFRHGAARRQERGRGRRRRVQRAESLAGGGPRDLFDAARIKPQACG